MSDARLNELAAGLSSEERARADRALSDARRREYLATRGMLRELLAGYSGVPGGRIALGVGLHGKPYWAGPRLKQGITFNVAHSQGLALFAVAVNREVGVDVEWRRAWGAEATRLAGRFASVAERGEIEAVSAPPRSEAVAGWWTRKEAYLKATGTGLARALDTCDVPSRCADGSGMSRLDGEGGSWLVTSFEPAPGYTASVVAAGEDWEVVQRGWIG